MLEPPITLQCLGMINTTIILGQPPQRHRLAATEKSVYCQAEIACIDDDEKMTQILFAEKKICVITLWKQC